MHFKKRDDVIARNLGRLINKCGPTNHGNWAYLQKTF